MWKKFLSPITRIFKKRVMRSQNNSDSLVHINVRRKPKSTVKNYQWLGYISYDATTSTWVTFSYELTGSAHSPIQHCHTRKQTFLLAHRCSPFLTAYPGNIRLIRFSFACSRRQTTRRHSEAPKDVPDHTLCRALTLHSLTDLFTEPPPSYYTHPPPFSFSGGVRKIMNHSAVNSLTSSKSPRSLSTRPPSDANPPL